MNASASQRGMREKATTSSRADRGRFFPAGPPPVAEPPVLRTVGTHFPPGRHVLKALAGESWHTVSSSRPKQQTRKTGHGVEGETATENTSTASSGPTAPFRACSADAVLRSSARCMWRLHRPKIGSGRGFSFSASGTTCRTNTPPTHRLPPCLRQFFAMYTCPGSPIGLFCRLLLTAFHKEPRVCHPTRVRE